MQQANKKNEKKLAKYLALVKQNDTKPNSKETKKPCLSAQAN